LRPQECALRSDVRDDRVLRHRQCQARRCHHRDGRGQRHETFRHAFTAILEDGMKLHGKTYAFLVACFFALCAAPIVWALYSGIVYLTSNPRFEVQKLTVSGLKRVEENEVLAKAGFEVGTNVFRVKLDEIRERVEELQWVRYALVERVLPDQIIIKII